MDFPSHRHRERIGLGLIGAGAFGAFAVPHLRPFFDVAAHDPRPDLAEVCAAWGVAPAGLAEAAARRVVVLAVPLGALRAVARAAAPHLTPGSLVVDVCSVKLRPLAILRKELPAGTRIVGTHPLFGPASGRNGISGLTAVVCGSAGGGRLAVERFLRDRLSLDVVRTTPEAHDMEMARVQALSHLVARSLMALGGPSPTLKTAGFRQLDGLVDLIGADSTALFDTIVGGNPFAPELLGRFLAAASDLVMSATCGGDG